MVELYVFNDFEFVFKVFCFFYGDNVFIVDFFYCLSDYVVNFVFVVCRNGFYLRNFVIWFDFFRVFFKIGYDSVYSKIDIVV